MDNSDEETNGSFEFVDKVTDSSDTDKSGDEKKEPENEDKWEDILGSGNLLKKVIYSIWLINHRASTVRPTFLTSYIFQILKKGGDSRPERRDTATITYDCRLGEEVIQTVDNLEVSVSDCEVRLIKICLSNTVYNIYSEETLLL